MKISSFSPAEATTAQLDAWYSLKRDLVLEIIPDEPVFSKESLIERVQHMKSVQDSERWCVWADSGDAMIGYASICRSTENNGTSPVWFYIEVAESFRKKGIGKALLRKIVAAALKRDWKLLQTRTCGKRFAGEQFIEKTGAERVEKSYTNRLELSQVNKKLLNTWIQFPYGSPRIAVREWIDLVPEERLQETSNFYQTVYDAGREQHGHTGYVYSPEKIRKGEKVALAGNRRGYTLYAVDTGTDRLLGLTGVSWTESGPTTVSQGYTAVLPAARSRGIGRRLKAEMLLKIPDINPDAKFVRTGNAGNNHTILKINSELGFSRLLTNTFWKIKTEELGELLEDNGFLNDNL